MVNMHFLKNEYLKYAFEYLNFEYFFEIHFEQNFNIPNIFIIVQTVLELFYLDRCLKICHTCAFLTFSTRNVEILQILKYPYLYL